MRIPSRRSAPLLHVAERRGEGPTVILIHGVASSSVTFQNVIPLLEADHLCVAIDLLGFGESPAPLDSDYTIDEHAAAIERTVRSLRLPTPFTIVGHSMGALFAARLAARYPRVVDRVVMVSPPIYVNPTELSKQLDRLEMDLYLRAYAYVRANKDFTLRNAKVVERFLAIPKAMDINETNWIPFTKSLENSIESQTTISDLAAIRVPVEIVYGNLDEFSAQGVMKIVSRLTGVTTHQVRGSDHLIGKRLARAVAAAVG